MKRMLRKSVKIVVLVGMVLSLTGCGQAWFTGLPTVKKAEVVQYEVQATYKAIYDQCLTFKPINDKQKQVYNETIVPAMNKIKKLMISYDSALITWDDSGNKPVNIDKLKSDLDQLFEDIIATGLINLATGK